MDEEKDGRKVSSNRDPPDERRAYNPPDSFNRPLRSNAGQRQVNIVSPGHSSQRNLGNGSTTTCNSSSLFVQKTGNPISHFLSPRVDFPCLDPINPHMRSKEARLQAFNDRSSLWPLHRIRATPEEIADAGMYFLGEKDRVKCWYCNGGLQNWEFNDDPWIDHAKWFPMCEYLLQRKGPEFVQAIIAQFPNLSRPMLYNPSTTASAKDISTLIQNKSRVYHSPPPIRKVRSPIPIVDPQEEMRKERLSTQHYTPKPVPIEIVDSRKELRRRNQKADEYMRSSVLVSEAIMLGFEKVTVKRAVKGNFKLHNQGFTSLSDLLDAIQGLESPDGDTGDSEV